MPSTPIEENRPQILVPQWRFRERFRLNVAAPVINTWYELTDARQSDADAYYFVLNHTSGANRDLEARLIFDGITRSTLIAINAVTNTLYYIYIEGVNTYLSDSINRTPIAGDMSIPGHGVRFWFRTTSAATTNLEALVRMVTL